MSTPKKKTKTRPGTVHIVTTPAERDEDFSEEIDSDIEQFLSEQGEQSMVTVYRIGKPGERDGFLDVMSPAALMNPSAAKVVSDTYGAGSYRLRLRAPNERGVLKYAGQKTLTIAERPGGKNVNSGNGALNTMEQFYREESARNNTMILALIGASRPAAFDMTGFAALITAVTGGNKQSDLSSVVAAFRELKTSAEPPNGVTQIKEALELARSINPGNSGNGNAGGSGSGDGETETSWPGLIKGALTALAGAGGRPMLPAAQPAPGGSPVDYYDEESRPAQGEGEMMQQWLQGQLGFLKSKAMAGKPADFWVQYTIDNADEVGNQAIFAALKGGATFDNVLTFDPEIAQNATLRVWFQKFYDGLKRSLSPAPAYPWIVGNTPNPPDHANPGTDGQPGPGTAPGGGNSGKSGGN